MNTSRLSKVLLGLTPALALLATSAALRAQDAAPAAPATPTITVNVDQVKGDSSPYLFGFMTEEINFSYDGGLYAELIRNRSFKDNPDSPDHWYYRPDPGAEGNIALDTSEKLNDAQGVSLKMVATKADATHRVGFSNDGYWGIPVRPSTTYHASFYAKADGSFTGPISVAISGPTQTYAYGTVPKLTNTWQKYEVTLTTAADIKPTADAQFLIWTNTPGTAWFSLVSLFPPTYNNRPNGLRPDIMKLLADYNPGFLRFPGGNYLEGNTFETRFNWKDTVGEISQRPGHMDDAWRYRSDDGLGLLEFLEWCEDLHMQPVLAVYAGLALRSGEVAAPGAAMQPIVQDALDEIEYVTGDVNTKWGAQRAKDGHPAPFKLTYVEIGNEDWRGDYNGRFTQLYDAIKAKYPNLQLIDASVHSPSNGKLTSRVTDRTADVQDSHLYTNSLGQSDTASSAYDNYDRKGPKVFEGEWATRVGAPTPNFTGALGDAAYMTGLIRNSDIVVMASYAPLFVNVNPGGMQWPTDLIGYNALTSYGSPAFYAQAMFNKYRGNQIVTATGASIPTFAPPAPPARGGRGGAGGGAGGSEVPSLYYVSTRDSQTGKVYLNLVNQLGTPQPVHIDLKGVASVDSDGQVVTMKADSLTDTNSISDPTKIVPVTSNVTGLSSSFDETLAPYSINIFEIGTK